MSAKAKNIIERAVKTFIEVAVTSLIAAVSGVDILVAGKDRTFWIATAISVGSAAFSAMWNGVLQPWLKGEGGTEA
jgi:hypothetical protein